MKELRAFVGHSFGEHDKPVVGIFLEHFTTLARVYPQFSWEHAEEAEPLPLSKKVLAKIDGKNLFVGICTRYERVIQNALLRPARFQREIFVADEGDLQWKASDWLIQEIGLAVGLNMSIILFLEEGVRRPGGLFGDIEYIPFRRESPHPSFDKFLQMLSSLSPNESAGATATVATEASGEEAPATDSFVEDWVPRSDWTKEKYQRAAFHLVVDEKKEELKRVSDAFAASIYAHGAGQAEWDGTIEWFKFLFSGDGDFEKIKKLADQNPKSSVLRRYVARVYTELTDYENAATNNQLAASIADKGDDQLTYDADAAILFARAGKVERALEILETVKRGVQGNVELQTMVLERLQAFAGIEKDDALELAALERLCELRPADAALRFQLAYKHSQSGNPEMALHHYMKIPIPARHATTWNNLGVSFGHFHMPVKAMDAFKLSEQEGESLAMSNIGNKLLSSGFLQEAQERATKALQIPNYHANIHELLKRLREVPEEEDEKQKEILEKVKEEAIFYRMVGDATLRETPKDIGIKWMGDEVVLEVRLSGTTAHFEGSYEGEEPLGIGSLGMFSTAKRKVTRRVEYAMRLRGEILVGEVKRTTDGVQPSSLLALGMSSTKVVMVFQASLKELRVMEGARFRTWTRVE